MGLGVYWPFGGHKLSQREIFLRFRSIHVCMYIAEGENLGFRSSKDVGREVYACFWFRSDKLISKFHVSVYLLSG